MQIGEFLAAMWILSNPVECDMSKTRTYAEWSTLTPWSQRIRNGVRSAVIAALAIGRRIDWSNNWIRCPFYHHIFDDERQGFRNQLDYLRNFGEFISLDDAHAMLVGEYAIDGRYFCLTFDDGLKSCVDGALPILSDKNIPAAFYVVTDVLERSFPPDDPVARATFGFNGVNTSLDFLSWEDCRELISAGMTIGSHTASHARLSELSEEEVCVEMGRSKNKIEENTGHPCRHFCAPYGNPDRDFHLSRDGRLAMETGYSTFATGLRGPNRQGSNPFALRRDHMLANWGMHQLKYFLSLD